MERRAIMRNSKSRPDPAAGVSAGHATQATLMYQRLRRDIVSGRLLPGARLRIEALASRYSGGAGPLREALNRLTSEGLVDQQDQRGFQVSPVSLEELEDLARTRCWIDEIGLREAIRHGDLDWEESIVLAFHRLNRHAPASNDDPAHEAPEWDRLHQAFHTALIGACPSKMLIEYSNRLFDRADRYRNLVVPVSTAHRDIPGEHRAIMEATIGRRTDEAIRLANEHVLRTAQLIREHLSGPGGAQSTLAAHEETA